MRPNGQGREVDGYTGAPAPALQRIIGRFPLVSAAVLLVVYVAIGIRTGTGAYYFPNVDNSARAGILLVWLALMVLIAVNFLMLWISSRLRWFKTELRQPYSNENTTESVRLFQSGARLVNISQRLRPVAGWLMGLAVAVGVIGIVLLVVFFP